MTIKLSRYLQLSRYLFVQNFIKFSAVIHELPCAMNYHVDGEKQQTKAT